MRRLGALWTAGALVASAGLFIAWAVAPGRIELEVNVYLLVLGGLAIVALTSWLREVTRSPKGSPFESALSPPSRSVARLPELERLEREVHLGTRQAFDLHYRLRPILREIAERRLERDGLRLGAGGPRVRATLGEDLWEVVRPDREAPEDPHAPGLGVDRMRRIVERLEAGA